MERQYRGVLGGILKARGHTCISRYVGGWQDPGDLGPQPKHMLFAHAVQQLCSHPKISNSKQSSQQRKHCTGSFLLWLSFVHVLGRGDGGDDDGGSGDDDDTNGTKDCESSNDSRPWAQLKLKSCFKFRKKTTTRHESDHTTTDNENDCNCEEVELHHRNQRLWTTY